MENVTSCQCEAAVTGGIALVRSANSWSASRRLGLSGEAAHQNAVDSLTVVVALGNRKLQQVDLIQGQTLSIETSSFLELNSASTSISSNNDNIVVATSARGEVVETVLVDDAPRERRWKQKHWNLRGVPSSSCIHGMDVVVGLESGRLVQLRSSIDEPLWESRSSVSVEAIATMDNIVLSVGGTGLAVHDLRTSINSGRLFRASGFCSVASNVNNVAFATGDYSGEVCIWDIRKFSRGPITHVQRHDGWVSSISFNSTGRADDEIVSAGSDGFFIRSLLSQSQEVARIRLRPLNAFVTANGPFQTFVLAQDDGLLHFLSNSSATVRQALLSSSNYE